MIVPVPGKVLDRGIFDFPLLACLLVLEMLLVFSINPKFPIIILPAYWQPWIIGKKRWKRYYYFLSLIIILY